MFTRHGILSINTQVFATFVVGGVVWYDRLRWNYSAVCIPVRLRISYCAETIKNRITFRKCCNGLNRKPHPHPMRINKRIRRAHSQVFFPSQLTPNSSVNHFLLTEIFICMIIVRLVEFLFKTKQFRAAAFWKKNST